jgi:hypothetical protein
MALLQLEEGGLRRVIKRTGTWPFFKARVGLWPIASERND